VFSAEDKNAQHFTNESLYISSWLGLRGNTTYYLSGTVFR